MPANADVQERYWESITERRSPFHPVVAAFAEPKVSFIRAALPAGKLSMLEVGAGNGFLSVTLSRYFDLWCVDFSPNMLAKNPMPAERKIQGVANELPFEDRRFDVVLCANLLHHLEDPEGAVREMARVARRNVVLIEPNAINPLMFLFGLMKPEERGTLKFTPRYVKTLGWQAGLELTAFSAQGMILPNKAPPAALSLLRAIDYPHPLGFYLIAIFRSDSG